MDHNYYGKIRGKAFLGLSFAFLERSNQSQMDTNSCWFPRMEAQKMTIIPSQTPVYCHYLTPHVCRSPPPHQSPNPKPSLSLPLTPHSLTHSLVALIILSFSPIPLSLSHSNLVLPTLSLSIQPRPQPQHTIGKQFSHLLLTCAYLTE